MEPTISIVFAEPPFLDLGLPKRRPPKPDPLSAVAGELVKLEKSSGQLADEIIADIDSLHEPVEAHETAAPLFNVDAIICVECWTKWPCGTHKTIYGEDNNSCVHKYRPGTSAGMV